MSFLKPATLWAIRFYLRLCVESIAESQTPGHDITFILAPNWPLASGSVRHKARHAATFDHVLTGLPATDTRPSVGALHGLRLGHRSVIEKNPSIYRMPMVLVPAALGPVGHILDLH